MVISITTAMCERQIETEKPWGTFSLKERSWLYFKTMKRHLTQHHMKAEKSNNIEPSVKKSYNHER